MLCVGNKGGVGLFTRGKSAILNVSFVQQACRIMVPVALQQAINMGVNMMDTIMLGSLGEVQLTASSLANSFYNIFTIFCMGIIGGCSVLSAQYWGAGDRTKTRASFCVGIDIALFFSVVFGLLTILFPAEIMRIYTDDAEVIACGVRYLRITAAVYLFHGPSQVVAFLMRSVHKPKLGLYVSILSFCVNVFANWVFIFGKLGAPRLEIAGAAVGTLLARITEFAAVFIYVLVIDDQLTLRLSHVVRFPGRDIFQKYLQVGLAALISDGLLGLGINAMSMVLGRMGKMVVSAYAICQIVDRLLNVVISGISNAAAIMIGNTIGEGQLELAREQGKNFCVMSILYGIFSAALILVTGPLIIRSFNLEAETIRIGERMMRAFSFICLFQGVQNVMSKGVLRGGGDTRFLLVADILFLWVTSIPLGILTGLVWKLPAWVSVISLRIDWVIKSFWCVHRLNSGKWIHEVKHI